MLGADVGQLVLAPVGEAVAGPDDVGRPLVERVDEGVEPLARLDVEDGEVRTGGGLLSHQVTEGGVAVLVHRGVEADVVTTQAIRSRTRSMSMPSSVAISCGSGSRPS